MTYSGSVVLEKKNFKLPHPIFAFLILFVFYFLPVGYHDSKSRGG
jgi:hypothetical protein